jgi:hypothetical protein
VALNLLKLWQRFVSKPQPVVEEQREQIGLKEIAFNPRVTFFSGTIQARPGIDYYLFCCRLAPSDIKVSGIRTGRDSDNLPPFPYAGNRRLEIDEFNPYTKAPPSHLFACWYQRGQERQHFLFLCRIDCRFQGLDERVVSNDLIWFAKNQIEKPNQRLVWLTEGMEASVFWRELFKKRSAWIRKKMGLLLD